MYCLDSKDEWTIIHQDDLWVYNKLILSIKLGHLCGPTGVPVPYEGDYVVRPMFNLLGMGRNARIEYIKDSTEHFHPSEFWSEIFYGQHLSVDFYKKESKLVVEGIKDHNDPLYKWSKWQKISKTVEFPEVLSNLKGNYDWINCEFIGDKLIEVHFRQNPDFRYGNTVAIPVWDQNSIKSGQEYTYILDEDYHRKGFYIN
jgi:hypothetical protein